MELHITTILPNSRGVAICLRDEKATIDDVTGASNNNYFI